MSSGSGSLPLWPDLLSAPFSSQLNWVSYQGGSHMCALRHTSSNPSARGCRTIQLSQEIAREDTDLSGSWICSGPLEHDMWSQSKRRVASAGHIHCPSTLMSCGAKGSQWQSPWFYLFHHLPLWFFPARTGIICHCFWDFHCSRWCLLGRTIIYNLPTVQMQSMFLLVKPFFKNSKKFFKTFKRNK